MFLTRKWKHCAKELLKLPCPSANNSFKCLTHGDLHWDNIVVNSNKAVFIDVECARFDYFGSDAVFYVYVSNDLKLWTAFLKKLTSTELDGVYAVLWKEYYKQLYRWYMDFSKTALSEDFKQYYSIYLKMAKILLKEKDKKTKWKQAIPKTML